MIVNKEVIETVDKWTEKNNNVNEMRNLEVVDNRTANISQLWGREKNRQEGEKMTIENEKESIADGWQEKKELAKLDISAGILFTAFIDRH